MSWLCPICKGKTVNACPNCPSCKSRGKITLRPDSIDLSILDWYDILLEQIKTHNKYKELDIYSIIHLVKDNPMTPEEQLFSDLFNHETVLVSSMDTLTLRAHIEELSKIAKEAKIRYYAADKEEKKRVKTSTNSPTGFSRSVNEDPLSKDAINTVKDRQKRLTAKEKIEAGLIALGIDPKAAASLMSAGVIKARLEDKNKEDFRTVKKEETEEKKPFFNPFVKKVE